MYDKTVERGRNSEASECALLRQLRLRDREGLERVVRRYSAALVRAAYLHLGDAHAAEDMTQETFIAAWDAARRARPQTHLRSWLFGILFNRCRKYQRSMLRRVRRERTAARRRNAERNDHDNNDEQLESLRRALTSLDEDLRAVVILRYERGCNLAETAEALGLPVGTVKSRTHAAIRKIRRHIRQIP
jgi:RNA polymerase sigma factor (sigma-70 family)